MFLLEICSVVNGTTKKEIGRAKEFIVKHLEVEMGHSMEMGTIHAADYLVSLLLKCFILIPQFTPTLLYFSFLNFRHADYFLIFTFTSVMIC